MAARPSQSNDPPTAQLTIPSRRSSATSNHNVFSDEYALESASTSSNASPINPASSTDATSSQQANTRDTSTIASYPPIPGSQSNLDAYLQKRPLPNNEESSTSGGNLDRSASTSTRFSIPRSQSPYTGPTAPSHPYAMYPQVTRASSIASESTLRPQPETPFVPRGGPEHPYDLYPQNTVPEEDEDITAGGIPLGFPSRTGFQSSNTSSNSDVGDIVGRDGHIEQLPPYTRYADNTVAKGNMENIHGPPTAELSETSSHQDPAQAPSTTASTAPLHPTESFDVEADTARKEGWKDKAQKRVCAGVPLWCLALIVVVVIIAATLGGVIGGVIGNRQGADRALANFTPTTVWLDAIPTTLAPNSPTLPTGNYTIPLQQSQEINNCIADATYDPAWGCLDYAFIGVRIQRPNPNAPLQAIFEDYSINTADFHYGPQPPDFNGTAFDLQPFVDKDADDAQIHGIAMFFSVPFDKLSIIPEHSISENYTRKRSISVDELNKRETYTGPLLRGDKPWFCFWNSTINEFWVYLDSKSIAPSTITSDPPMSTSGLGPLITSAPVTTTSVAVAQGMMSGSSSPSTTFAAYNPTPTKSSNDREPRAHHFEHSDPNPLGDIEIEKRDTYTTRTPFMPDDYPKLIKMIEKRQPSGNVQPYCQKMQVLDNYQIVPLDIEPICIEELEYSVNGLAGPNGGSINQKRDENVQVELQSNCICEWLSH